MRNGLKIGWSILVAFSIMISVWTFSFQVANADIVDGDYTYSDDSKTTITAYSGAGGPIAIPDGVTTIGSGAFAGTSVTSVNLNGVRTIGDSAFANNENLTSVSGGNSVVTIGSNAFGNTGLTSFSIPSAVTSLAQDAFSGTATLTSFDGGSSAYPVYGGGVYSDSGKTLYIVPEGISGSFTVSSTATTISERALNGTSQLTDLYVPSSVTTIADGATAGSGVTTIYGYTGSVAETYANEHSLRFVSVGNTNTDTNTNNNSSNNSSNTNSGSTNSGGTTTYIYYDDDDDDDDEEEDDDDDDAEYNDREYDVEDDDTDDLNDVTELPNTGSGYAAANNHSLDTTPTTADGDIDPKFVFCVALFLIGLAGLIFARQRSLIRGVNREAEESDELD